MRFAVLITSLLSLCVVVAQAGELSLAVNAPRGQEDIQKWNALAAYLSAETGEKVTVSGTPPARIDKEVESGAIKLALMNPVSAADVIQQNIAKPLATLKAKGTAQFAGAIITRADSPIKTVADLKGKNVMAFQTSSAGAYVFQMYYVQSNGLDPKKDFSLRQSNKQDDIVLAVQKGLVDVGFVRSGLLESMAKEGKIKLTEFALVDGKNDELKLLHSTPLYPEWFLVASNKLDPQVAAKIKAAVLKLKADQPAARDAGIDGFIEPLSLDSLKEALRALKVAPFG
ncbi:phosphate/phosphite/phosphonate ABC transporter substrate-binding protein [Chitinimonas arctica]|uniref:Phosphate/phosphite/phosphonate ABC transporter substrate-binding protein n=1 Tax=Chitinimonas arctica TaxID=2594795 RepID=A0A516SBP6_9NEIS|nr:phosphate/phosphite/phosphonate ABC transporter substrate-binding protein [Chitinimonas arctica]QDQ25564.1 phosphate/phosphite/phosphonate ABC transporter substrate-binding protein [Chitinimonas arctica]